MYSKNLKKDHRKCEQKLLCTNSNASRAHSLMSGSKKDVGVPDGLNTNQA